MEMVCLKLNETCVTPVIPPPPRNIFEMYRCWAESVFFCFLVSNDGNIMDSTNSQNISYDVSKLIDFPGFNVPAPSKMKDVSLTI